MANITTRTTAIKSSAIWGSTSLMEQPISSKHLRTVAATPAALVEVIGEGFLTVMPTTRVLPRSLRCIRVNLRIPQSSRRSIPSTPRPFIQACLRINHPTPTSQVSRLCMRIRPCLIHTSRASLTAVPPSLPSEETHLSTAYFLLVSRFAPHKVAHSAFSRAHVILFFRIPMVAQCASRYQRSHHQTFNQILYFSVIISSFLLDIASICASRMVTFTHQPGKQFT